MTERKKSKAKIIRIPQRLVLLAIVMLLLFGLLNYSVPFLPRVFQSAPNLITEAPLVDASMPEFLAKGSGKILYDQPNGKLFSLPISANPVPSPLFRLPPGTFAFQPVWSPVTEQIAYGYIRPDPETDQLISARLWIADLDSSNARMVSQAAQDFEGTYSDPAWSPDGSSLWASVQLPQKDDRGVIRFRSEIRRITVGNSLATDSETVIITNGRGPALSPDNQWIAYLAEDENNDGIAIWRAKIDGTDTQILVDGEQFEEFYVPMRFSPDGQYLAFAAADAANQLQRTPPAPSVWQSSVIRLANALVRPATAQAHGLYPADVWLVDVETGKLTRLTQLSEDHPTPVWSPDGRHLAFAGVLGVYIVDVENRNAVRITDQGIDGQIEWLE